jgi:peptidoglycan/xylan/chitin deacetylase (PgdA/CDA1 family)
MIENMSPRSGRMLKEDDSVVNIADLLENISNVVTGGGGISKITQHGYKTIEVPYNSDRIIYEGTWSTITIANAIKGEARASSSPEATATLEFTGEYIGVALVTGGYSGIAEIFLDGESVGEFDCYSPHGLYPWVFYTKKLPFGKHTIQVKSTGERNEASGGSLIYIDHFIYDIPKVELITPLQPGVIITFDDTRTTTYKYARQKLEEYGFKATCYINPGISLSKQIPVNGEGMDRWMIHWLKTLDYEITSHGWDHTSFVDLSEDELREDLRKSIEWLRSHNMDTAHLAPPYNIVNTDIDKIVSEYHATMVIGGDKTFNINDFNPLRIPRFSVNHATDFDLFKEKILEVKSGSNKAIVLMYHGIVDDSTATGSNITRDYFDATIDYIANLGLKGMRMKDFIPV